MFFLSGFPRSKRQSISCRGYGENTGWNCVLSSARLAGCWMFLEAHHSHENEATAGRGATAAHLRKHLEDVRQRLRRNADPRPSDQLLISPCSLSYTKM
jgi:hypothetical protein